MSDDPFERYTAFLENVVDSEYVWTLADERDNPVLGEIEGHRIIPLWARKSDAEAARYGPWSEDAPLGIHVMDILEGLVPEAQESGLLFSVTRVAGKGQWVVAPDELERDLRMMLAARPSQG